MGELVADLSATHVLSVRLADREDTPTHTAVVLDDLVETLTKFRVIFLQPQIRHPIEILAILVFLETRQRFVGLVPNTDAAL